MKTGYLSWVLCLPLAKWSQVAVDADERGSVAGADAGITRKAFPHIFRLVACSPEARLKRQSLEAGALCAAVCTVWTRRAGAVGQVVARFADAVIPA